MSESIATETSVLDVLAGLERFEDELAGLPLELCTDDEIVAVLRRREVSRRKAAVLDQRLIEQTHRRSIWFAKGCATVVVFLRMLLRISPAEASARFRAARLLGRNATRKVSRSRRSSPPCPRHRKRVRSPLSMPRSWST